MELETQKVSKPSPDLSRREKLTRRLLPAVALSLAVTGVAGYGANALKKKFEYHDVGSVTHTIGEGQTPIDAVRESVDQMSFKDEDGQKAEITGVVSEGQEVGRELKDQTGDESVQPGESIEVTVSKNGFGNYKVEADPAQKPE